MSQNTGVASNLKDRNIDTLINQIKDVEDFTKEDTVKFLIKNRELIYDLMRVITNPRTKLKPDDINLEYIQSLLDEVKGIRLFEESKYLVTN